MSIAVAIEDLAEAIRHQIGWCYLLTVSDSAQARLLAIVPAWDNAGMSLHAVVGQRTADNVNARPNVSMVWPPADAGGYSLIADGIAIVDELTITFTPTSAVLHRSAVAEQPS